MKDTLHTPVVQGDGEDTARSAFVQQQVSGKGRNPEVMTASAQVRGEDQDILFPAGIDARGIGEQDLHVRMAGSSEALGPRYSGRL